MSTLVTPLVNGFADAPSGTAEFYVYGSDYGTPAMAYSDPDCTIPLGTSVTLNASGRKVCFVKVAAEVVVRNFAAAEVVAFPVIMRDTAVMVASTSFTGTLPSGSQGAGGVLPLNEVADLWDASADARDYKVRRTGSSVDETLVEAFEAVRSTNTTVFNVKDAAYGAIGNGTSDDYTSISRAIAAAIAAGGGRVYFPAGTYLLNTALSILSNKVTLYGDGAQVSILKFGLTSGDLLTFNASAASAFAAASVRDLALTAATTCSGRAILVTATPGMTIGPVDITGFHQPINVQSRAAVQFCNITQAATPALGTPGILVNGSAGGTVIDRCKYVAAATAGAITSYGIQIKAPNVVVRACELDMAACTSAPSPVILIDDVAAIDTVLVENRLTKAAGAFNFALSVTVDVPFYENGNGPVPVLTSYAGAATSTSRKFRGSRLGTVSNLGSFAAAATATPDSTYEHNFLTCTGATVTIANPTGTYTEGMRLVLTIFNNSGGLTTVTFGTAYNNMTGLASFPTSRRFTVEFRYDATTGDFFPLGHAYHTP